MRTFGTLIVALVLLAACGDDGGSTVDTGGVGDEFCATLAPLADIEPDGLQTDEQLDDEQLDQFRTARDAAPNDRKVAFDTLIALAEALQEADVALDVFDSFTEEELNNAFSTLIALAEDCGLTVALFDANAPAGERPSDAYDATAMREQIEAEIPDVALGIVGRVNNQISIQVQDLDENGALTVCESAELYLESIDFDAELRITDTADTAFAHRPRDSDCAPGDVPPVAE